MFLWDKSISVIDTPASQVVNLFRSMREVQLALPGISSQQASAYLCQYRQEGGVCTAAVFHLHKNQVLAFYLSEPRFVPEEKTDSMLEQGLNFVESMGFLMTDQDIHLLDDADQEMLWESLPIRAGISVVEQPEKVAAPVQKAAEKSSESPAEKVAEAFVAPVEEEKQAAPEIVTTSEAETKNAPAADAEKSVLDTQENKPVDNVDDLLAAVEAMRAKRPGLRVRKSLPPKEEMERRRLQLRETVGRILASM